jgi:hypothetical protein
MTGRIIVENITEDGFNSCIKYFASLRIRINNIFVYHRIIGVCLKKVHEDNYTFFV